MSPESGVLQEISKLAGFDVRDANEYHFFHRDLGPHADIYF